MSPNPDELVSDETRAEDDREASAAHEPDRMPTDDEVAEADKHPLDPKVAENYEQANKVGANVKGEGEIE
jgi:hypothetical protein